MSVEPEFEEVFEAGIPATAYERAVAVYRMQVEVLAMARRDADERAGGRFVPLPWVELPRAARDDYREQARRISMGDPELA